MALQPPRSGDFESLLQDLLVTAFHLTGTDGRSRGLCALVIQWACHSLMIRPNPFVSARIPQVPVFVPVHRHLSSVILNEDDVNHATARGRAGRFSGDDFVICEVHVLELPAAVRAATHRSADAVPAHVARRVINRFDRSVTGKIFIKKQVDMSESVAMARSLGETHGWKARHTTFELWHLAAAWSLSAGAFLTFDRRQERIAVALGMKA